MATYGLERQTDFHGSYPLNRKTAAPCHPDQQLRIAGEHHPVPVLGSPEMSAIEVAYSRIICR
jgi:hypothetical protein